MAQWKTPQVACLPVVGPAVDMRFSL